MSLHHANWAQFSCRGDAQNHPRIQPPGRRTVRSALLGIILSSVERRVGNLERCNEWANCTLYWGTNNLANGNRYSIPTNFPTRELTIIVAGGALTNFQIRLPVWAPESERSVTVIFLWPATDVARSFRLETGVGTALFTSSTTSSVGRIETLDWDGLRWRFRDATYSGYSIQPNGGRQPSEWIPDNAPTTVEEWLVLHPEWATTP